MSYSIAQRGLPHLEVATPAELASVVQHRTGEVPEWVEDLDPSVYVGVEHEYQDEDGTWHCIDIEGDGLEPCSDCRPMADFQIYCRERAAHVN